MFSFVLFLEAEKKSYDDSVWAKMKKAYESSTKSVVQNGPIDQSSVGSPSLSGTI